MLLQVVLELTCVFYLLETSRCAHLIVFAADYIYKECVCDAFKVELINYLKC